MVTGFVLALGIGASGCQSGQQAVPAEQTAAQPARPDRGATGPGTAASPVTAIARDIAAGIQGDTVEPVAGISDEVTDRVRRQAAKILNPD